MLTMHLFKLGVPWKILQDQIDRHAACQLDSGHLYQDTPDRLSLCELAPRVLKKQSESASARQIFKMLSD